MDDSGCNDNPGNASACPRCGAVLSGANCSICNEVAGAEPSSDINEPLQEGNLVADLREAFGLSAEDADPDGTTHHDPEFETKPGTPFESGGRRFGDYQIIEEIARGGMGVVYRARQLPLDREVALKLLPGAALRAGSSVRRFRTEARAVARLQHPNIVQVFEQGELQTHVYYAMALVDGCNLNVAIHRCPELLSSTALQSGSWSSFTIAPASLRLSAHSPRRLSDAASSDAADEEYSPPFRSRADYKHLAGLVAEVADALAHAHSHGVIHRDIKPHNLLLSREGRLFVTDFGLSVLTDEPHLTITGEMLGTPAYLSPEQARGEAKSLDHRTDIYSLGVTLYELLTGTRPFTGKKRDEIIRSIRTSEPARLRRIHPGVPRDLENICLKAMEKDPARRYQTASEMAEELRRFAAGQPVLARPPGAIAKGLRLIRAHKVASIILISWMLTSIVTAGYIAHMSALRTAEGDRLLQQAYEQLVYTDYRRPEVVQAFISQAALLDPDPTQLAVVQALAELGASENINAIALLEQLLADRPDHRAAWYLLAWAQRRANIPAAAATLDHADSIGPPATADEWFFRGLASHFDHPQWAVDSYSRANALRAQSNQFFPQAVLHLARAHNQRMYNERDPSVFEDAQGTLLQLVKQQQYAAFPHYLLSITQRLYGEILEDNPYPVEAARAPQFFQAALDWARAGQQLDPQDALCITAEAECLERLGNYADAIAARTRAIAQAPTDAKRCEGFHYRWRLHYWLGDLTSALRDVREHAACMPESLFYSHVYPAWIAAEQGNIEKARAIAGSLPEAFPQNAHAVIWAASTLRLLGYAEEADDLLDIHAVTVNFDASLAAPQTAAWVRALYAYSSGALSLTVLRDLADTLPDARKLHAEANFHAAMLHFADGRHEQAKPLLKQAYKSFDSELRYTFHAKTLLMQMESDAQWPPWITN